MNLLIVDDHQLFSDGLGALLGGLFPGTRVECAASGGAALERLRENTGFDLVLVDLDLHDMSGFAVLSALRERGIAVRAAVISASEDAAEIRRCLDAGAIGYIHKSANREQLRIAVTELAAGRRFLSPLAAGVAAPAAGETRELPDGNRLTRRQGEVLDLLASGLLNKQIADRLGTSEHTVKIHVSAIMKKFGVHTRTACVSEAGRLGLLRSS